MRWVSVLYGFRPVPNLRVLPRRRRSPYDRTLQDALRPTVLLPERFGPSPPGLSPSAAASLSSATLSRSLRRARTNYSIGAAIFALVAPSPASPCARPNFQVLIGIRECWITGQSEEEANHNACGRIEVPGCTQRNGGSSADLPEFGGAQDAGEQRGFRGGLVLSNPKVDEGYTITLW